MIQIDAPRTVASFLQRLGRTGRRSGNTRNCLFLCLEPDAVLAAAGLLERWAAGWVEPIVPPVAPRHIAAQQILALALQEHTIGTKTWREWWGNLPLFDHDAQPLLEHLLSEGYLERDGAMAFIGPEAERKFGRRYFSDLLAVFSAPPEFTVLTGRTEIGRVGDDVLMADDQDGPRVLLLAGRTWQVGHIDWKRRRCFVEPTGLPGKATWGGSCGGLSFDLTRAQRTVLLGTEATGVTFTQRAQGALDELREAHSRHVADDCSVFLRTAGNLHWWTWAGTAANRTLHASLPMLVDARQRIGDRSIRLRADVTTDDVSRSLSKVGDLGLPHTNESAIRGLKFSAALPSDLAHRTIAERLGDHVSAATVLEEPRRFYVDAM